MIDRTLETECRDGWTESHPQMSKTLYEVLAERDIVRTSLAIVLPLAQRRIGEGHSIGIYKLVVLHFLVQ